MLLPTQIHSNTAEHSHSALGKHSSVGTAPAPKLLPDKNYVQNTRAPFKPPDEVSRTEQLSTVKRKELFHAAMTLKNHNSVEIKNLSKCRGVYTRQICFPTWKASLKREGAVSSGYHEIQRLKNTPEVTKLTCKQYFSSNLKNLAFKANHKLLWSHLPAKS